MEGVSMNTWQDRTKSPIPLVTDMEFDVNVKVKGVSYTQSSFDPSLANLASTANWTQVATSAKHCGGVYGSFN
jgi:hypothetical protein